MGSIISIFVKRDSEDLLLDEVPLSQKPPDHEGEDYSCDVLVGKTKVSAMIGSGSLPDTDFLTYKFEVQKLREEVEKLTKELKLAKKENEGLRKQITGFQSVIKRHGKKCY